MMSNHSCMRAHLNRINIIDEKICVCGEDYETIDHVVWDCFRYQDEIDQLLTDLSGIGITPLIHIRDLFVHIKM
jgi:hypothetical protein